MQYGNVQKLNLMPIIKKLKILVQTIGFAILHVPLIHVQ